MNFPRSGGILLHPTSLPGPYGIGDLGPQAYRFIDWLSNSGGKLWQILPLGPTGYGDSPYQCFSAFAGNPYLISPDFLLRDGLLTDSDLADKPGFSASRVDFGLLIPHKLSLLSRAFDRYQSNPAPFRAEFDSFCGIRIIGDIPIFVAYDSADVWANSELFFLDEQGNPTVVAGVPPDGFSATGQLWGNPLYRWEVHKQTGYAWWIKRMKSTFKLFDILRLDHFRGFAGYYEIPAADKTAEHGRWVAGPGADLFAAIDSALGGESGGGGNGIPRPQLITPDVIALLDEFHLPGMKVLQFGFSGPDNPFLPHNYVSNCVAYTGTHDNDTARGWLASAPKHEREFALRYLRTDGSDFAWDLIRAAWSSVAMFAIAPMQDVLNLGGEARMNFPSKLGGNWEWRMKEDDMSDSLAEKLHGLNYLYKR
ncbi:MAG: 4-alpha-glucanotransferase [Chloroflexi bacterium]|nr:4-alpha-glucanotransferase [Chloroflexota bacterium]